MAIPTISVPELKTWLHDGQELAILDPREEESFSVSHLLHAANLPLSRIEDLAPRLLPRRGVRIAVTDHGEGLAARAAELLQGFGYENVSLLAGGNLAWAAAGQPLYSGVHVPSKAFAEVVEHDWSTPWITARDLKALQDSGEKLLLIDARPAAEHANHTIPGSIPVPGAELPRRIGGLVSSDEELVVVHCGGRTRSIIGAQALISAGLPNRVVSLKDGTMAWALEGYDLRFGAGEPGFDGRSDAARASAARASARIRTVTGLDRATIDQIRIWQDQGDARTVQLLDVRSPQEFRAGHVPGSRSAPGGQLVQETDSHVAVLGARLVLIDDGALDRAQITAFWLRQLGWTEILLAHIADFGPGAETGDVALAPLGLNLRDDADLAVITPDALSRDLSGPVPPLLIDLSLSRAHAAGHVPGARWALRARLAQALAALTLGPDTRIVLTSEEGTWARLAARDLLAGGYSASQIVLLQGGTAGWRAAGLPVATGITDPLDEVDDVWFTPRERKGDISQHLTDYLDWETALLDQIRADEDSRFQLFAAPVAKAG